MFGFSRKPKLSAQEAVEGANAGTVTVIDVRDHSEIATSGKASGALHIPLTRLSDMADPRHPDFHAALCTDAKIAVYCASGARSSFAARTLRKLGYQDVHNIGGLGHWIRAGGKTDAN